MAKQLHRKRFQWAFLLIVVICGRAPLRAENPLQYPIDVAATADGTIYIADRDLPGIWKLTKSGISEFFRGSKKFGTPLNAIRCLALDKDGQLLAGDSGMREVFRFGTDAKPKPLTGGKILIPSAITVKSNGEIWVVDQDLKCVWKIPPQGGPLEKIAVVPGPVGISSNSDGTAMVLSRSTSQLRRITSEGKLDKWLDKRPFQFPHQIVSDDQGTYYVTDGYAAAVWKCTADKKVVKLAAGSPLVNPVGICRAGDRLLVADSRAKAVFAITFSGKISRITPP